MLLLGQDKANIQEAFSHVSGDSGWNAGAPGRNQSPKSLLFVLIPTLILQDGAQQFLK
ncbi:hypothetical protein STEG23_003976, partial [Scotinomys teguina]